MSMPVREILKLGEKTLRECGVEEAAIDSKLLFCHVRGIPRNRLIMEYQKVLPDLQCEEYFRLLDERGAGRPLQYIVGDTEFMGLTFKVDENVLIPRQDTEILVEQALAVLENNQLDREDLPMKPRKSWDILDLCTGSGAIGISVAKLARVKANVTLSDISEGALAISKSNAVSNGVTVSIEQGDLFEPFEGRFRKKKFDMILSNPPYVRTRVIAGLQREIRDHEPMLALDGGEDGLDLYRRIVPGAADHLKKEGVLMMEIGWDQKEDLTRLLTEDGRFENIRCVKDLAKLDRVMFAVRKAEDS